MVVSPYTGIAHLWHLIAVLSIIGCFNSPFLSSPSIVGNNLSIPSFVSIDRGAPYESRDPVGCGYFDPPLVILVGRSNS